jgi:hypothetical protein
MRIGIRLLPTLQLMFFIVIYLLAGILGENFGKIWFTERGTVYLFVGKPCPI